MGDLTTTSRQVKQPLLFLQESLKTHLITVKLKENIISFAHGSQKIEMLIAGETFDFSKSTDKKILPLDLLITAPEKIAGMMLSKFHLNKIIFARKCLIKKVDKKTATAFFDAFHFLNSVSVSSNYGIYYHDELMAVASFSKGRKMNRLKENERSYELVRFCSRPGFTVTGGMTRLVKNFCIEKNAGDVMTYVDKQFSDGRAFANAGFIKHSETPPVKFIVNRKTFARMPLKDNKVEENFYITQNSGNIKMIFRCHG